MTDTPGTPGAARRFRLTTFGTLALAGPDDDTVLGTHGHHRRRLALLAVLAAAGSRGRSRDQLLLLFWPDATQARARHSLYQLLYALRTSIDDAVFAGSNPVSLDPAVVGSDVGAFHAAIERGDFRAATAEYRGPFLDGFYLDDAPEFERWVEEERARIAASHTDAVERLAREADASSDVEGAVRWWRKLAELDPLSSTYAMGLIRAYVRAGDHPAAQQHGERFANLVERELDTSAGPAVAALLAEVRAASRVEAVVPVPGAATSVSAASSIEATTLAGTAMPKRRRRTIATVATALVIVVGSLATWWRGSPTVGATGVSTPTVGRPPKQPTSNIAAYDLYVRGTDRRLLRNDSTAREGLAYLRQAVALDSNFAAGWAGLARMSHRVAGSNTADRKEYLRRGEEYARRAVAVDDSLAEAHEVLAAARMFAFDFAEAEQHLLRAIALDPSDSHAHEMLVTLYLWTQRPAIALDHARKSVELEPLSAPARAELAHALIELGRCTDALPTLDSLARLQPPLLRNPALLALCHATLAQWPQAIAALRPRQERGDRAPSGFLGFLLARNGNRDEAVRIAAELRERVTHGESRAYDVALVYFGLNDRDEALKWLQRTVDDRSLVGGPGIVSMAALMGPLFAAERRDPRVAAFLQRLGSQNR